MESEGTESLSVLIVEDEQLAAEAVTKEVDALGWSYTVVSTVQAARAKFADRAFDIIVLDRMLDDIK